MSADRDRPSSPRVAGASMAAVPTWWTVFLRTFIPWQVVRFAVINLKMFRLIWRSH
jgi:hypothetical protein